MRTRRWDSTRVGAVSNLRDRITKRLQGRIQNADTNALFHPDAQARYEANIRSLAYQNALYDVQSLFEEDEELWSKFLQVGLGVTLNQLAARVGIPKAFLISPHGMRHDLESDPGVQPVRSERLRSRSNRRKEEVAQSHAKPQRVSDRSSKKRRR